MVVVMMVIVVANITGVEILKNIVVKDANLNLEFVNQHKKKKKEMVMNLSQALARLNG